MKALLTIAAGMVALGAMPAAAEPTAVKTATEEPAVGGKPATKKQQFCYDASLTGSRVPVRECRTRADWASRGVDVDQRKR